MVHRERFREMRTVCTFICLAILCISCSMGTAVAADTKERTFIFTYTVEVVDIPEDAHRVSIWLPYPRNDAHQEITLWKLSSSYPTFIYTEPECGNTNLYITATHPEQGSIKVEVAYKVRRREHVHLNPNRKHNHAGNNNPGHVLERWLQPDKFVPIDDYIKSLAREVTDGKTTDLEKARSIYDYIVKNFAYDKSGTGWGRGDIYYACNTRRGNCSDFHSVFIGFCRSVGIPAKFDIGFPLPDNRGQGEISGYHCWAEFYLDGYSWIPVDTSEANKNPAKKEYFFGSLDENRVQFTVGRDIVLNPPQAGEPLNYFIYPYVEVDGKPFPKINKRFSFKDI